MYAYDDPMPWLTTPSRFLTRRAVMKAALASCGSSGESETIAPRSGSSRTPLLDIQTRA